MNRRLYNVMLDLHAVSGIIFSVVIFIIFFAGSFSFFRDEIVNWERNHPLDTQQEITEGIDALLDSAAVEHRLHGRDVEISKHYSERRVGFYIAAAKDSLATESDGAASFFYIDTKTYDQEAYESTYTLGEFIYRLHFLAQIPYPFGYYLAGFVALMLLFALITGIWVHWDKLLSNILLFRPWAKAKIIWTDLHTVLGTWGIPFQLVYAVTGSFFMIKALLIAPSVMMLYDGDQNQMYAALEYTGTEYPMSGDTLKTDISIDAFIGQTYKDWDDFLIDHVHIANYGDANMHITLEGKASSAFKLAGPGFRTYHAATANIVAEKSPYHTTSYMDQVKQLLYRLHFGDYGGYLLKFASFLMGLLSCAVVLSGVMIWITARDKKNVDEKKKRFNAWLGRVYLSICWGMFPALALTFILVKGAGIIGEASMYTTYFSTWLITTILLIVNRDYALIARYSLWLGGVLSLMIPVVHGLVDHQWIWNTLFNGYQHLFIVDMLWLTIGVASIYAVRKITR